MKEMIIVTGRQYDYKNGELQETNIGKRKADKIFQGWLKAGKTIRRKYGMGGRVVWIWPE